MEQETFHVSLHLVCSVAYHLEVCKTIFDFSLFIPRLLQHVPKINGDIPSADEEISDHQRLLERFSDIKFSLYSFYFHVYVLTFVFPPWGSAFLTGFLVLIVVILSTFLDSWISILNVLFF